MRIASRFAVLVLLMLTGCKSVQYLIIVDPNGHPLKGAVVSYAVILGASPLKRPTLEKSDSNGHLNIRDLEITEPYFLSLNGYQTETLDMADWKDRKTPMKIIMQPKR